MPVEITDYLPGMDVNALPIPCIISGLPFAEYLQLPYLSCSLLKYIEDSPGHLLHALTHPRAATSYMSIGSAADLLLTEGEHALAAEYWVSPGSVAELDPALWAVVPELGPGGEYPDGFEAYPDEVKPNTKAGREAFDEALTEGTILVTAADFKGGQLNLTAKAGKSWREMTEAAARIVVKRSDFKAGVLDGRSGAAKAFAERAADAGAMVLNAGQMAQIRGMAEAVEKYPLMGPPLYLEGVLTQLTIIFRDEASGVICKCRPDLAVLDGESPAAADIKTTASARPGGQFSAIAADKKYHWQQELYTRALRACGYHIDHFYFWAVERAAPHRTEVFELGEREMFTAVAEVSDALHLLAACQRSGDWPVSSGEVQPLGFRAWRLEPMESEGSDE